MTRRAQIGFSIALAAAAASGCSKEKKIERPSREVVEPLLQQEAQSLKAQGEQDIPSLGVETRWNLARVEVREQAGNQAQPWAGTVSFKIVSRTRDGNGNVTTERFEKSFDYEFDLSQNRWLMR
jgi:hypothetical protein